MRILVIEDNSDIAANIGDYLEDQGHVVDFAGDGVTGLHLAVVNDFDAIVLDLSLPGMDGLEVCRKLRQDARRQTPVLMLTARDALEQKADRFRFRCRRLHGQAIRPAGTGGAPGSARRAAARACRAACSTRRPELQPRYLDRQSRRQVDPAQSDRTEAAAGTDGSQPSVVTRQELETRVWGEELPDSDSLRVHIHGLRAAIDKPFDKPLIQTRHGIGYRMVDPDAVPGVGSGSCASIIFVCVVRASG